jgi:glycosyltransferase involved in cell wall biosynthesis
MKRNVLFVVPSVRRSGPTRQLLNLVRGLPEFGYECNILTLREEKKSSLKPAFDASGVSIETVDGGRLTAVLTAAREIGACAASKNVDVIHSHGFLADLCSYGSSTKTPKVATARNDPWVDYLDNFGSVKGRLMAYTHDWVFRRIAQPVACSNHLISRLSKLNSKAIAIRNGVDTQDFRPPTPEERQHARAEMNLPGDAKVFLHVGSLISRKRPEFLLRNFIKLAPEAYLVFVGDGPLRAELEALAQSSPHTDRILFIGTVDTALRTYWAADALVSLSASEGMPNVVMEALSCGLPTILSSIAPHLELGVEKDGAGDYIAKDDPEQLLTIFQKYQHAQAKQSDAARTLALTKLSARETARAYASLYDQLLASA